MTRKDEPASSISDPRTEPQRKGDGEALKRNIDQRAAALEKQITAAKKHAASARDRQKKLLEALRKEKAKAVERAQKANKRRGK